MDIDWTTESVFDSYNIFEETFKTVGSHHINTAILVPKTLVETPGKRPIIYHLHGGFLVTAHGLFTAFVPKWVDKLALEHSAIIVSPDHRLLPSANGLVDVLEDLEDGWQWTKTNLTRILEESVPGQSPDFEKVLLAGGSAGGYCSVQLAFSHPESFNALAMVYPLLDTKDKVFVEGPGPEDATVLRVKLEDMPSKEDTLAWITESRKEPHTKAGFERTKYAIAACHNGIFTAEILDNLNLDETRFSPLARLKAGEKLPSSIWLMHGEDDSTVRIRGSREFVAHLQRLLPHVSLRYDVVPGQDHAFDFNEETWESFAPDAMKFLEKSWLSI